MTKHEIRKEIKAKRAMLGEAYIKNNNWRHTNENNGK